MLNKSRFFPLFLFSFKKRKILESSVIKEKRY